jgi:DNA-binding transcriptional LysR family regulator
MALALIRFMELRMRQSPMSGLVRLLSKFPAPVLPVSVVYSSRRHLAPRTRLVLEFVLEQIRQAQALMAAASDETRSSPSGTDLVSSRTGN